MITGPSSLLLDIHTPSLAAHPRHSFTERFRVHISPRLARNKTRWHRQLEHCAATPRATRIGAAEGGRAVEIARRVGDQVGYGTSPVAAAGEAVEHVQGPRGRQLENRARADLSAGAGQHRP